jgi:hypothetical protein
MHKSAQKSDEGVASKGSFKENLLEALIRKLSKNSALAGKNLYKELIAQPL